MKTKTAREYLRETHTDIYNSVAENEKAFTVKDVIFFAEKYASQLPASVTDEQIAQIIDKAVHGATHEWTSHDEEESGKGALIKELRSLLNHPPVMGEGEKAKEEIRRMFIDFCQSQEAYKIHTSEIELEKGIDDYLKSINPHQANT